MRWGGRLLWLAACCFSAAQSGWCYPAYFVQQYSNSACTAHPDRGYKSHGDPAVDRDTTVQLEPLSSLPNIGKVCPGARYTVKVQFPQPRLALLTSNTGSFEGSDSSCANRLVTPGRTPQATWQATLSVPCTSAGQDLQLKVSSAQGSSGAYQVTTASVPVSNAAGQCQQVSTAACGGGDVAVNGNVVSASRFDPNSQGAAAVAPDVPSEQLTAPTYRLRPILKGNMPLWQFLHSLLMLMAFGLLLPLGVLLARHKWMFGRNPETGKVLAVWFHMHLLVQLLGLLAAIAGVVLAILAFGWKDVPGVGLYLPHKWIGVGVMGMAILQLLVAPLRPAPESHARSSWNFWHHSWGRLTLLAGAANTVVGALLVHDMKNTPYLHWLLPACAVLGLMLLLALCLEAFKLQMQRTYRYNAHTGAMLPVMLGHKHSRRRRTPAGQMAAPAAGAGGAGHGHQLCPAGADDAAGYNVPAYPVVRLNAPPSI